MPIVLTPISQPTGLVTTERAALNAKLAALDSDTLSALLLAASAAIERATGRAFGLSSYREYLSGAGFPGEAVRLTQFPVTQIDRVAVDPQPAIRVFNTSTTSNQRATVATTETALVLYRMTSGVASTVTLTFSDYPTLDALATAIGAVGFGWSAVPTPPYGAWPSLDLKTMQGAASVLNSQDVSLLVYTEDLTSDWRLDASAGILWGWFPTGHQNIRVDYTAGFATVPEDVQQACVELAQHLLQLASIQVGVTSQAIGPYRETFADPTTMKGGLPPHVMALLGPYVDHSRLVAIQ